jgi:hypothetical protein
MIKNPAKARDSAPQGEKTQDFSFLQPFQMLVDWVVTQ